MSELNPGELRQRILINQAVLAALREEADLARRLRLAAGWDDVASEIEEACGALRARMAGGDLFDRSLAIFVARELDELAREIRLNLNLRVVPQWPN